MTRPANGRQFIRWPANDTCRDGFDSLNWRTYWLVEATTAGAVRWPSANNKCTQRTSLQHFSTACGRHPDRQKKLSITRQCLKKTCWNFEHSYICVFDQLIILHYCAGHFRLKKWTWYTVIVIPLSAYKLQIQQKSNLAKSESGWILGIGYPNPVSGRKSISVHPYFLCMDHSALDWRNWVGWRTDKWPNASILNHYF